MPNPYKSLPLRSYEGRDQVFTIAAPVLAGFSVTSLGVLIALIRQTLCDGETPQFFSSPHRLFCTLHRCGTPLLVAAYG